MADQNGKNNPQPTMGEVLSADLLGPYMSMAYGLPTVNVSDPTWAWYQLVTNPWMAMAIYEDMEEKDAKVGSDLETRKESVLAKERVMIPASDKRQDKKIADFVWETLESFMGGSLVGERLAFDNVLWELLDSIGKGVTVGEIIWNHTNDRVFAENVRFKPQHMFSFAEGPMAQFGSYTYPQTGRLRLNSALQWGMAGIESERPLEERYPYKWMVHTFRPRQGNRWGTPQDRRCFWPSWIKRAGVRQWLRFLEKGPGTMVTKYSGGAGEDEQNKALAAAQAMMEEAQVAIPDKFQYELIENIRGNMGNAHQQLVDDFCNNEIARVILGQTLTSRGSEGGGSRALGEVHERVAGRKTEVDAKSLMLVVNTELVWPITLFNFGAVPKPPVWTIKYEPGADVEQMSKVLYRGWQMRVPITKKFYYTTMQWPEPTEGEELLEPPSKDDEDSAVPGGDGEDTSFAEEQKKKSRHKSSNTHLKQPTSKRERFSRLRPSMMRSSDR